MRALPRAARELAARSLSVAPLLKANLYACVESLSFDFGGTLPRKTPILGTRIRFVTALLLVVLEANFLRFELALLPLLFW